MSFDSSKYRMADRLAGGALEDALAAMSAEKLSLSSISSRLFADYGIEVSPPTVALWVKALPSDEQTADVA